ncbi:hypothetical protein AB0I22_30855 [Streptomyces sp. NPDC050610]|uniref:MFS transporter n=1 Tax=Streptomyces sp. NPDC050610 TaxID=3157097 RepID=UPI00343E0E02
MGEDPKARLVHTYVVFGLLGSSVSIIGVHAYEAAETFDRASVAAAVLQFRFTGALLGSLAPTVLCRWFHGGTVLSMLLAVKIAALALLVFGDSTLVATYLGDFLLGLTTGGCLVYLSTQAVQPREGRSSSLTVTTQQASFGLGATLSLAIASLNLAPAKWPISTTVFGALLVSFAAVTIWSLPASFRSGPGRAPKPLIPPAWSRSAAPTRVRTMALLYLPLYAAVFLYAGVENGWTGWLYTWLTQTAGTSGQAMEPLLLLACFWGMVTIGRSAAVLVMGKYRRIRKEVLGIASAALVALASALACLNLGFYPILALAAFIGPIYPAILSVFGGLPHSGYLAIAMTSLASTFGSTLVASNMGDVIRSAGPASFPGAMAALGLVLVLSMLLAAAVTRTVPSALGRTEAAEGVHQKSS